MSLEEIRKSKFVEINSKKYYFSDGIISLPFSHPLLHEVVEFKRNKKKKLNRFYRKKNINLSKWKNLP